MARGGGMRPQPVHPNFPAQAMMRPPQPMSATQQFPMQQGGMNHSAVPAVTGYRMPLQLASGAATFVPLREQQAAQQAAQQQMYQQQMYQQQST